MTLEKLLENESDKVLLDIYEELSSCVVPATGYAHEYCRKVNKLINKGELCVIPDKYRNVYLPTLSKMIFKELSRRYVDYCFNAKGIQGKDKCAWCEGWFNSSVLHSTDQGTLCEECIEVIRSSGEELVVFD